MAAHLQWTDLYIAMGALSGLVVEFERWRAPLSDLERALPRPDQPWPAKVLMLAIVVVAALMYAHTLRGFMYLLLQPLGAYVAFKTIAAPLAERWGRRHQWIMIAKWKSGAPM